MRINKKLTFAIVTHVYATGPSFKLEEYIKDKIDNLIFIGHPFSFAPDTRSFLRIYKNGKLIKDKKFIKWKGPEISFYIKDFLLTLWWLLLYRRIDYFVGVDNLNAFAGYILKILFHVKKIIFYTIDYVPNRFSNKLLNSFYHFLDQLMVSKSNNVWNLSPVMVEERERKGINKKYRNKQLVVPIGTDIENYGVSKEKIDPFKIAFMGHLRSGHGIEMLVSVMPDIIKKLPSANLFIIGGGPLEEKLKEEVKQLKLENNVKFTGFIKNFSDVQQFLRTCSIAAAPYEDDDKTFTRYTDPGKVKDYLACGLPLIITRVPQVAFEIEKNKCGITINYDQKELSKAIITLLTNKKLLSVYKENAIKMSKKYTWNMIFDHALEQSL